MLIEMALDSRRTRNAALAAAPHPGAIR
jgi:hypothetical protein